MARFDDNEELAEHFDLEYWLEREGRRFKVTPGASGRQLNIQECPACHDRRWKCYVNADTGRGNCFICNKTWNKFGFVHAALGHDLDAGDAVRRREWRETFQNIKDCMREQGWRPKRVTPVAVEYGEAKMVDSIELPTPDGRNLVYLEQRGITGELSKFFRLRYCIKGQWDFKDDEGKPHVQRFDNRVIIPVFDLDGTFVTFQGRDVTGLAGDKKYLFPMGLPGTGRYLLNGHNGFRTKRACMGEGFFDVAAIKIALDQDVTLRDVAAIGSFGKHLSGGSPDGNDQLTRLVQMQRQGLEELTIMWDGEVKALEAALTAADMVQRVGIRARVATLPFSKDPNEVVPQVVREAFYGARPYSTSLAVEWRLRNPYKGLR